MAVDKFSNAAGPTSGLNKIVPTSVTVGTGSGSVDATGKITFSSVSDIKITNVFSSNYDNYQLVINLSAAASGNIFLRLLQGSTSSSTNYSGSYFYTSSAGAPGYGATNTTAFDCSASSINDHAFCNLSSPFLTRTTVFACNSLQGNTYTFVNNGIHSLTNSYDGIQIFPGSGSNASGTARIYGYN
jgi:hypothetical protein